MCISGDQAVITPYCHLSSFSSFLLPLVVYGDELTGDDQIQVHSAKKHASDAKCHCKEHVVEHGPRISSVLLGAQQEPPRLHTKITKAKKEGRKEGRRQRRRRRRRRSRRRSKKREEERRTREERRRREKKNKQGGRRGCVHLQNHKLWLGS